MAKSHAALRAFGLQLRQTREGAGISGRRLAELLDWPQSKISKLENGQQAATPEDVEAWADATGPDERERLLAELGRARTEYSAWRQRLSEGTGARQLQRLRAEADVQLVRAFEPAVVPGLLQIPDYARAVLTGVVENYGVVDDVDEGVRHRMRRQEALYDISRIHRFLLYEAALYCRMAPPPVMRAQLDRLVSVSGLDSVELSIVPFTAAMPIGPLNGFWIFDDSYVLVETLGAELAISDPADVALYARIFDRSISVAVAGDQARGLLLRAASATRDDAAE